MGDEIYPTELRAAPRRVVSLLRLESLHEPLAAQLTAHHGFHVISIADPDAERTYLPEVPERKPQNHYETYVAKGILKKAWVEKHTQLVPVVVVVLFEWEEKPTWKAVEAEVGNRIDRIRHDSRHRPVQILCVRVVHTQQTLDEREEAARQASFRKRADLEPSCILSANCETPVTAARRLAPALRELADVGYKKEAWRLKQVKACVKTTQAALYVRLQFKIGFYDEFRQDWRAAVSNYRDAYDQLTASLNQFPGVERLEAKAVAEYLNYKLCAILVRMDSRAEAIRQFRGHLRSYKPQTAPDEVGFEHWTWIARQYFLFGQLLEAALSQQAETKPDPTVLADRWQSPGLYYHAAAKATKQRRKVAEALCGTSIPGTGTSAGGAEQLPEGPYYGQLQLVSLSNHSTAAVFDELAKREATAQHSLKLVELLSRAYEHFKRRGDCRRMIHGLVGEMAEEYYLQGEYGKAQKLFESICPSYREEGWGPILGITLRKLLDCAVRVRDGRRFVQAALELMAVPQTSTGAGIKQDEDRIHRAQQTQGELWAVLGVAALPDGANAMLDTETIAALRGSIERDDSTIHFDVTNHPLVRVQTTFDRSETFTSQEVAFSLEVVLFGAGPLRFSKITVRCTEEEYQAELTDSPSSDASSVALKRTENLEFHPAMPRRFVFQGTATRAAENVRIDDILFVLAEGGLSLRWDASVAAALPEANEEFKSVELGPTEITILPPEAKASVSLEYDAPVLVDEFFPVTVVAAANEDTVQHGAVTIVPAPGDSTNCKVLGADLSPVAADGVMLPSIASHETAQLGAIICCTTAGSLQIEVAGAYDTPDHLKTLKKQLCSVPCLLPFAATFRFSPQKSGGRSDPTNHNVVLLQGQSAIIEVSLESRSPHPLELLSLDIEVHTVAAGKAAASQLQRAGWTAGEGIDVDEGPDASSAFEDQVPAEQAAMPLAVVTAVTTPLPRAGKQGSPLLQKEGQISTHLFNIDLPSSADDVSLGRAVLRWRRYSTSAGTRAVNSNHVATSSCDLPVITVQRAPLVAELIAPLVASIGAPIDLQVVIENRTSRTETLSLAVGLSDDFAFSGLEETQCAMLPHTTRALKYVVVPLTCGKLQLPQFSLTSSRSDGEWFSDFSGRRRAVLVNP